MAIYELLLQGGTLLDPAQSIHAPRDVAFVNGRVAAVAENIAPVTAQEVVDCTGFLVTPGVSHYGTPLHRQRRNHCGRCRLGRCGHLFRLPQVCD